MDDKQLERHLKMLAVQEGGFSGEISQLGRRSAEKLDP